MAQIVLGIGYDSTVREAVFSQWKNYNVAFRFVDTTEDAVHALQQEDFICVTVCSPHLSIGQLEILRNIKPVPIVVLSPESPVTKRAEYFQRGAAEFIVTANRWEEAKTKGQDAVEFYLDCENKAETPLTIVTVNDLYFCLEYRTLEVQGRKVELTGKEFDIFALLISHPKRVFTFEMIMDLVWGEEYSQFTRKTLINHMSSLRRKLRVSPDAPNYIVNLHGVGYKFDPDSA